MRHGRVDRNQAEIVKALRKCGASVQSLADIGKGCPDLLVGFRGVNYLMEVKDGEKPPSKKKLTDAEEGFMCKWRGQYSVVETIGEALAVLGILIRED